MELSFCVYGVLQMLVGLKDYTVFPNKSVYKDETLSTFKVSRS